MASSFDEYAARDAFFGEAGPVCMGHINRTQPHSTDRCATHFNGHCSPYGCVGRWSDAKIKLGSPHVVE